jgi:diguanylate cyclase (GGDEF)-like protein
MLTSQLEMENLAEKALELFFLHTGAAGGLILYEYEDELKIAASRGLRKPDIVAASDQVRFSVKTGKQQFISLPEELRVESVVTDFRPAEVRVLPIIYKSVPLGVLVLATGTSFIAIHRERIELFLQGLGLAMNNALDHDRLQRLAALDPLTGIYNRRFGLGRLHEEFGRAVRNSTPLGVLMFDIDHFKNVNDTYGHLVGDRVLKSICTIARSSMLREGDVLLRYGGEEFVVVLPAASAYDIRIVAERLRKSVEDSSLSDGAKTVRVTISIGGAAYPDHNVEDETALLRLSDEALYRAKNSGRNRVEIAR